MRPTPTTSPDDPAGAEAHRSGKAARVIVPAVLALLGFVLALAVCVTGLLYYQGKRAPTGTPQYVALGSSFAAGIGLGARAPSSPFVCMRTVNGYPQQLARMLGVSLVDMSCSGATTKHVLHGGQAFLGSQLRALDQDTQLVTLTIGGNDVRYVGDLSMMAGSRSSSFVGWAMRRIWSGPLSAERRRYAELQSELVRLLQKIRSLSPRAKIVVVTYPAILPATAVCPKLNISEGEAATMRIVGDKLAEVTRAAAGEADATLVDMHSLGAAHHACSTEPWVNGWVDATGTQFHPTLAGATATAQAIAETLRANP